MLLRPFHDRYRGKVSGKIHELLFRTAFAIRIIAEDIHFYWKCVIFKTSMCSLHSPTFFFADTFISSGINS